MLNLGNKIFSLFNYINSAPMGVEHQNLFINLLYVDYKLWVA